MSPLPKWLSCCAVRDADCQASGLDPVCADYAAEHSNDDAFFDCAETAAELLALDLGSRRPGKAPAEDLHAGYPDSHAGIHEDYPDLDLARTVLKRARELFSQCVIDLTKCGPELEWADLSVAKRMLRATDVDVKQAVDSFVRALVLRARYRELLWTMKCQTCCDIRILAQDVQERPVIYMCARSLNVLLGNIREQFMITLEAACRLTTKEGTLTFVVDMWGMKPHLFMDLHGLKELSEALGYVYAERIHRVMIVDFSRAAQAAWMVLKPMLRQKTRDKFAFVGNARAREVSREMFSQTEHEKFCKILDINRDAGSTPEDRELYARQTSMCSVPFGPPLR